MSRRRNISTDISTDPRVAELAEHGALPVLLYTWAIPHADDWGRITGDARQFRLLVCPGFDITAKEVDTALMQIAEVGLWLRYEMDGRAYIAFPPATWFKYQNYVGRDKRKADGSQIPAPADPAYRVVTADAPSGMASGMASPENAEQQREEDDAGELDASHRAMPQIPEDPRETPRNPASPSPSPSPSPSLTPSPTHTSSPQGASREEEIPVADALHAHARTKTPLGGEPPEPTQSSGGGGDTAPTLDGETEATLTRWRALSKRQRASVPTRDALHNVLTRHQQRGMTLEVLRCEILKLEDEATTAVASARPLSLKRLDNWLDQWHAPPPDTRPKSRELRDRSARSTRATASQPAPPTMIPASQASKFWDDVPPPLPADVVAEVAAIAAAGDAGDAGDGAVEPPGSGGPPRHAAIHVLPQSTPHALLHPLAQAVGHLGHNRGDR